MNVAGAVATPPKYKEQVGKHGGLNERLEIDEFSVFR